MLRLADRYAANPARKFNEKYPPLRFITALQGACVAAPPFKSSDKLPFTLRHRLRVTSFVMYSKASSRLVPFQLCDSSLM